METLYIKNFLGITEAEITLNRLNLFIGPQARGKSVIVKLLYFFKREVGEAFLENVRNLHGNRELTTALISSFEAIFPKRYWNSEEFLIGYANGPLKIELIGVKAGLSKTKLSIYYSKDWLPTLQKGLKKRYKAALHEAQKSQGRQQHLSREIFPLHMDDGYIFVCSVIMFIDSSEYAAFFGEQIFIPASRTFFANVQKNIFSFLAGDMEIDPLLIKFGAIYERAKRLYWHKLYNEEINILLKAIVSGRYLQENEQDWIIGPSRKINLAHASSGQQESLPMLLVLSAMPFMVDDEERPGGFYIEEPEAHLFPNSQKLFVSLLALLSNATPHQFFITTHSPYLLTALNNCILAASAWQTADENKREAIEKLMPSRYHVRYEDVAAWTVTEQGTVQSILDPEAQLIGANLLDSVSQEFEGTTNALLDLMYED